MGTIFKLIIEDDEGKTTVYPLAERDVSIGRKEGNTIRLLERNVSRRHARLSKTNGAVYIEDLDSYNGVKINGERIAGRYEVKEGDLVEIGDYHLALQCTEIEDPVSDESTTTTEATSQVEPWRHQGTVPDFKLPEEIRPEPTEIRRRPVDTRPDAPPAESPPPLAPLPRLPTGPARKVRAAAREPEDESQTVPLGSPAPVTALFRGSSGSEGPLHDTRADLTIGPATHSAVPRLVCVSTGYAGREFALTRPELVVGRVEDNDIVIEHRSVSRNHAKIVFDGRTHKIIDLQSANGILVNGEEYAMTDLRRGDLIELGHARFRFIPAKEPFYPTAEEAQAMQEAGIEPPPSTEGSSASLASEAPTDLPTAASAHDPSKATTVTDTPHDTVAEVDALHVPTALEVTPADETPPPRTSDMHRPADVRAFSNGNTTGESLTDRADVLPHHSEEDTRPGHDGRAGRRGRRTLLPFFVIALAVVAVVLLGMLVLGSPGEPGDEKIRTLRTFSEDGRHAEVIRYFTANKADLENSAEAWKLFDAARAARATVVDESPAPAPAVPDEIVAEPSPSPPPPPASVSRKPPGPERVALAPSDPVSSARKTKAPRRRGPTRRQRAKVRYDSAFAHLMFNRTQQAISELDACLRIDERFADCHRLLGSTWAEQRDSARAVKHYRRYLQLAPNARDASQIRAWIESYESSQ